jgi:hypothetical protein
MFGWLIENAIALMPTEVWIAIAITGAVVYYLSGFILAFPQFKPYGILVKVVGVLALVGGVFMTGGAGVTAIWQQQLKEANERIAIAEGKSKEVNVKIVEKVVKQLEIVHQKSAEVIKYVDREVTKYDNTCPVPNAVVTAHNAAALNQSIEKDKE